VRNQIPHRVFLFTYRYYPLARHFGTLDSQSLVFFVYKYAPQYSSTVLLFWFFADKLFTILFQTRLLFQMGSSTGRPSRLQCVYCTREQKWVTSTIFLSAQTPLRI